MRTLGTASWCLLMPQIHTVQATVSVFRAYWNWCRRRRQDSMSSSWTCAGKGVDFVVFYHIHIGNSYIYCHHSKTNTYCFRNVHDDATPNVVLKVTANIVFGYATWVIECLCFHPEITCWSTVCSLSDMLCWDILCLWSCQDAEAFELSSSGFTNGVFIKFLKERLLEDEKITVLLDRVAEGERTLSMLKLNEAWPLLLVKCRSIKLKQMINWFEMCAATFSTYLFCTFTTTSKINFKY